MRKRAKPAAPLPERKSPHPHDTLARYFLSSADVTADLLRHNLDPELVARLDLRRLKCAETAEVNETLAEQIGDLRFHTTFKNSDRRSDVFIFLEHQSTKDPWISLRLLRYIVNSYERHAAAHVTQAQTPVLPYPVAVVLYNGRHQWNDFCRMPDLIQSVAGVKPDVLDFPLTLIDLAAKPTYTIEGTPPVRALLTALQAAGQGEIAERLDEITDIAAEAGQDKRIRDWMFSLVRYAAVQVVVKNPLELFNRAYRKVFARKEAENMALTAAEVLRREGEARGKAMGKAMGEAMGKAHAILTVLESRFGAVPATLKKSVAACGDSKVLDSWTVLAATCNSLKEFKEGIK